MGIFYLTGNSIRNGNKRNGKYRRGIGKFYDKKMDNGTSNFGAMRNRIPGVKHITVAGERLRRIRLQGLGLVLWGLRRVIHE